MAIQWNTPHRWKTGEMVEHTKSGSIGLNGQLRDNMEFLSQHGHSGAAGDGSQALGGAVGLSTVLFADAGDPTSDAQIARNGSSLKVRAGGTVFSLSVPDINGTAPIAVGYGTTSSDVTAGDHVHTSGSQVASP